MEDDKRTETRILVLGAQSSHEPRLPAGAAETLGRSRHLSTGRALGVLVVVEEEPHSFPVRRLEKTLELGVVVLPVAAAMMGAGGSRRGRDDHRRHVRFAHRGRRAQDLVDQFLLGLPLHEDDDLPHQARPSCAGRPPRRFISHSEPVE